MDTSLFLRDSSRRRMAANGLGIILFQYGDWLSHRGHSRNTVHQYTQAVEHFGFWRSQMYPKSRKVKCAEIKEFLSSHLKACKCPPPAVCAVSTCRAALNRLAEMLKMGKAPDRYGKRNQKTEALVSDYDEYMVSVCGLSGATRLYRRRNVRMFLNWLRVHCRLDAGGFGFSEVMDFVRLRRTTLKPDSIVVMIVSLRSFTRYLEFKGLCPGGLSKIWPAVAQWKKAPPVDVLSRAQCNQLLLSVHASMPGGLRDRAILSLIINLGLRCSEVTMLQLDDIDWYKGTLCVRKTKQRRERLLPLPPSVGKAISSYLQYKRPASSSRALFLCHRIPVGDPVTVVRVRGAVRRALERFGRSHGGTHLLRHSFATALHSNGASLKEVADILGHQNLDTAAVYARVNLPQLRQVAMPWPGEAQ